ncbi:phospholipid transport system substrate-binding protein [Kerstersia gyiorum]|jgi:phospholipid transport system substrate-binding protein|nr:phospholipid transport system substrate-binding protein [Kerstersia gyiorum]MCP1637793.1 phospholipid transport system substrate-binding protein [Kerstersia gyiorum]MCP1671999.1 phospholipid transport system substrate-binding protein [Kerstersia gyiorum]MCP1677639.1 phospholipid transport system substrate-binding protein [Kerstersia gyiorum]MCP1681355.1 phospholipid transport system substrate-binding protein [Kerstersia gyiorum]
MTMTATCHTEHAATLGHRAAALIQRFALSCALLLGAAATASAADINRQAEPNEFVEQVALQALDVLKQDEGALRGDISAVNRIVDQYVLPYVDFQRTTRLAAGKYWREATPQQREALADAFRGTLIRTYSGALSQVDNTTKVAMMPFRGDATKNDVVVRSRITPHRGAEPVQVDYRLNRAADGWIIYDLNVEGIWLIENYRNQFAQEIAKSGMDGLIQALQQRNTSPES